MCCSPFRNVFLLVSLVIVCVGAGYAGRNVDDVFEKNSFDLGVVVSDLEKSSEFYTNVIGMENTSGFDVPADFAKKAGLTDNQELNIQVFQLGKDGPSLKLMEIKGADSAKVDHSYIHSSLGYSYLTLHITSTDAALKRIEKAGLKPVADCPVAIDEQLMLTIVRDPDGNLIELIGPK